MARRSSRSCSSGRGGEPPRPPLDLLRVAVYGGDGRAVVDLLTRHGPGLCLQWAGQGLLVALADGVEGATALAAQTAEALPERGLRGDEPLAEEIEAALGTGPMPLRAALPVDLGELATVMDLSPEMGTHLLHRESGELRMRGDSMVTGEPDEDGWLGDDAWIRIEPREPREAWWDKASFAESIEDRAFGERLLRDLEGRGAFRCFKNTLFERPELRERWFAWSEDRELARARAFLAEHRLKPALRP
ncbi:MAG: hypothetical protein ABIO70_10050 [Pseudomonadota bacterium]